MSNAPIVFTIEEIENRTQRIDVAFFNPVYQKTMDELKRIANNKDRKVEDLDFFLKKISPTHLTGGATPRGAVYVEDGVKFLRIQNIRENEIRLDKCVRIVPEIHERELKRSQLKQDDVLLTITGSYGLAAVVSKDIGETNINQHIVKIELDQSKITPQYLSFYLNSELSRSQMDRAVTGSSRLALDYSSIRALKIACPIELTEQEKITKEITTLRMEANSKLSQAKELATSDQDYILNELNLALPNIPSINTFSVDAGLLLNRFDAIAHNPRYHELLIALEKGNYKPKPLVNFASLGHKMITPAESSPLEQFKLVELEDIDGELGIISRFREYHGIQIKGGKLKFEKGQLLISRLRFYLRKVAIVNEDLINGVGSGEFYTLDCKEDVDAFFLKTMLRQQLVLIQAEAKSTGSSRPRLTKEDIQSLMIPDVPFPIQRKIGQKIIQDLKMIKKLRGEARELTAQAKKKIDEFLRNAS